jgi:hypothetical protein
MKALCLGLIALAIAGCATFRPVPDGYTGDVAMLEDSFTMADGDSCGSFFILYQYDGHEVENAVSASAQASYGQGFHMAALGAERTVPARGAIFHVIGRTHCVAPIQEISRTVYFIEGDVQFVPEANQTYVITGEVGPTQSAVWIEQKQTHVQKGNKLLVKGPSTIALSKASAKPEQVPPEK